MSQRRSISEHVAGVIQTDLPETGSAMENLDRFIAEHEEAYADLDGTSAALRFSNVISSRGRCGFAGGGSVQHLVNTDRHNRYRVTVRTHWRQGIESGQYDRIHISEAGGSQVLGCTDSGAIPVAYYSRQVVGESRI